MAKRRADRTPFADFEGSAGRVRGGTITLNATISACEKDGHWSQALDLSTVIVTCCFYRDTITHNIEVSAWLQGGEWEWAVELVAGMAGRLPGHTTTYKSAIRACEKCGQWSPALNLVIEMATYHVPSDSITFNAAASACGTGGQWLQALDHVIEMAKCLLARNAATHSATFRAATG